MIRFVLPPQIPFPLHFADIKLQVTTRRVFPTVSPHKLAALAVLSEIISKLACFETSSAFQMEEPESVARGILSRRSGSPGFEAKPLGCVRHLKPDAGTPG